MPVELLLNVCAFAAVEHSAVSPKKGFGNISGTITFANHANFWASKGLNLGNHDYQILATEGYKQVN